MIFNKPLENGYIQLYYNTYKIILSQEFNCNAPDNWYSLWNIEVVISKIIIDLLNIHCLSMPLYYHCAYHSWIEAILKISETITGLWNYLGSNLKLLISFEKHFYCRVLKFKINMDSSSLFLFSFSHFSFFQQMCSIRSLKNCYAIKNTLCILIYYPNLYKQLIFKISLNGYVNSSFKHLSHSGST